MEDHWKIPRGRGISKAKNTTQSTELNSNFERGQGGRIGGTAFGGQLFSKTKQCAFSSLEQFPFEKVGAPPHLEMKRHYC